MVLNLIVAIILALILIRDPFIPKEIAICGWIIVTLNLGMWVFIQ